MRRRTTVWLVLAGAVIALWVFLSVLPHLYLNWLWFGEVGYRQIFWGILFTKLNLGLVFGIAFFALVMFNCWLARRLAPITAWYEAESRFRRQAAELFEHYVGRYLLLGLGLVIAFIAWGVGAGAANQWQEFLWFRHGVPFHIADPIFHRDVSFYVFKLPFLQYIWQWFYLTLFAVLIFAAAVHYLDKAIRVLGGVPAFAPHVKGHLSVIIGLILLAKAVGYQFDIWNLLYSTRGVTFGVSYTDLHAQLPAYHILIFIAVACAAAVLVNLHFRGLWLPIFSIGLLIAASLLINVMYPAAIQRFQVQPNEFGKERPYIANTIKFTRRAYQLDRIKIRDVPQLERLSAGELAAQPGVAQNIRLWDWGPLLATYKKLQELRPYYDFLDVDVDRYVMNGEYRQVMLSARELAPAQVPEQTWQNLHLLYTHGYGAVLSPVNRVSPEGLPLMLVRDLPVRSYVPEIKISRPQLYFSEADIQYSIVSNQTSEVDYPDPASNRTVYTSYTGRAGIPLSGSLARTAATLRYGQINVLVSGAVKGKSKILINRNIKDRARAIAPFLEYDNDPYIVIGDNGRLYWLHDAYTISGRYPYSEPAPSSVRVNYIRNSVKVVTDAYNGTVTFYVADPDDPIIRTYESAFPGAFRPLDDMRPDLRRHLRWPEGLFMLQSSMYATYHMTDPQVFYTKEDKWNIAGVTQQQAGEGTPLGQEGLIPPYYIVTRLPDEDRTEFILMRPYTPTGKPNMIAWLAARADAPHYGELVVFRFPRDQTVFGPMMVSARIEQNTDISAALTLWRSKGSDVRRGNLLVIPVGKSLLYIEPLFLQAQEGAIPEMKRVIVAVGQVGGDATVVMGETLDEALSAALGEEVVVPPGLETLTPGAPPPTAVPGRPAPVLSESQRKLIQSALQHYQVAQSRLREGDWAGYGKEVTALGEDLQKLQQTQQ